MERVNTCLKNALVMSKGARYYKCAFQVNTYDYVSRHGKNISYTNEESYNNGIIESCIENNIEIISITDHYRIHSARNLITKAQEAGIIVFPGFEAVTKEGIHYLCLMDPATPLDVVQGRIGDCGIHETDPSIESPLGKYDSSEFLQESKKWNALCISAHICSKGGLLATLKGTPCIDIWTNEELQACAISGSLVETPDDKRPILDNRNKDYHRNHPMALINCQDVNDPQDLSKRGSSCWIKMSDVTIQGLRQAFLDPESRVRLATDQEPEEHAEIIAVTWEGGFLDGICIHLNENLNALIGGRGTGKSTLIESLRYTLNLEPIGDNARKAHDDIIRNVLKNGTKTSLLVRTYSPDKREFIIERTVPNPSVVKDHHGNVIPLTPSDIMKGIEIYGQHELAELSRSEDKLSHLLERFMSSEFELSRRKEEKRREMEGSRLSIIAAKKELQHISEKLTSLPVIEETLKRYKEAQVEDKLKEQSMMIKEERILGDVEERIESFMEIKDQMQNLLPIDRAFVSQAALDGLPGYDLLKPLDGILQELEKNVQKAIEELTTALSSALASMQKAKNSWQTRKNQSQSAYEKILRELQQSKVDGEEFIRLRKQFEDLHPMKAKKQRLEDDTNSLLRNHEHIMQEWEELKRENFKDLSKAAKKINKELSNLIRVHVNFAGNRKPLEIFLRENIGTRLNETIKTLVTRENLSLEELYQACLQGEEELILKFGLTSVQAQKLAKADESVLLKLRELELPSTTHIALNISPYTDAPEWRSLEDLSTGQKATALLFILLLESSWPLIIDQPEDDLDNRFIAEGIVKKVREEKRRRQFIFSTHNANIPVLGDAELVAGLSTKSEHGFIHGSIEEEHIGSIDKVSVCELIEEILEGGKNAFETRRKKYGF